MKTNCSIVVAMLVAASAVPAGAATLLSENFENDGGGFTVATVGGTPWAHGAPNSPGQGGGEVISGNGGSAQCWGTNLVGTYIAGTDTKLRTPVIDLTGVTGITLSFAQSLDIDAGHILVINVIDDVTDSLLEAAVHTSTDHDTNANSWTTVGAIAITGGQKVRIEWSFTGDGDDTYLGAYIDDVVVTDIPEPSTSLLALLSACAFGMRRRRS